MFSIECFGLIRVKINTPYTHLCRKYKNTEFDALCFYYPESEGYSLISYDVYSKTKLTSITNIGDLFSWNNVTSVSTTKFYSEDYELRNLISSLFLTELSPSIKEGLNTFLFSSQHAEDVMLAFQSKLSHISSSSETIYTRECEGIENDLLQEEYESLNCALFTVLKDRNDKFFPLFPSILSPNHSIIIEAPQCKFKSYLSQNRNTPLLLTRSDLDLGDEIVYKTIPVVYTPDIQETLRIQDDKWATLIHIGCDLTFVKELTLREILCYLQKCDGPQYRMLELELVEELSRRNSK